MNSASISMPRHTESEIKGLRAVKKKTRLVCRNDPYLGTCAVHVGRGHTCRARDDEDDRGFLILR